ncbi:MAG TPA: Co2+/Mg2+ efflux protein ApaG [Thermoanaerobaculaceae bacterium]|nr:Co2+/Mg2+ efflux protein ApaG [Thermoanaerobaculaceae bacterium]
MSDTTTRGIRVQVQPSYIAERSSPAEGSYFFAYRIRISNRGDQTVQLLRRHWIITDGHGRVEEVEGPGVVGETPVLAPGASFEYTSFCPLPTPFGTMQGTYRMKSAAGDEFDAEIGQFSLVAPQAVN